MILYKLVNKSNKKTYPECYNNFTPKFHFDGRITKLYSVVSENNKYSDGVYESNNFNIQLLGDIKTDLSVFKSYLVNTIKEEDKTKIKYYLEEILQYKACEGKAALMYMQYYEAMNIFDKDELLSLSIEHCCTACTKFLLDYFKIEQAERYIKDINTLDNIDFVVALSPHLSDKFIESIDVQKLTAKHRYVDVRRYLSNLQNQIAIKHSNINLLTDM